VGHPDAVARVAVGFSLPAGVPEALSPLLEIIPFQLLALHVAVDRGGDPDAPRGLSKITETL
jgi:glucosamine--fructose-6-phosphate aminotransferase (isomerizing)